MTAAEAPTVVVGYVPTPEGLAAADYAIEHAHSIGGARVVVVNSGAHGRDSDPKFASAEDLDALTARFAAASVELEIRQPVQALSPAEEILSAAAAPDAELIVIGLRRRSPIGKLFLGSSSQQVILDAACPVVAVKRRQ